jgi:lipid-binding SYLF domain-containing protein
MVFRANAQNCSCQQEQNCSCTQEHNCGCMQGQPCGCTQEHSCGCQQQQHCDCQQQQSTEAEQSAPTVQPQKPCVAAKPAARNIAPRNLPLVYEKEAERAKDAARVIGDFPPQQFLEDVKAIAVIPSVKKGAFNFGGRRGKGLMTKRDANGCWLPPSFIEITGANFGFQAGVEATDLVLVFTSEDAVNSVLNSKLTLNADAAGAAGPDGRKAQIDMPMATAGILSFMSKSTGAFAGISLDGAVITVDSSANHRVYGKGISGTEILVGRRVEANDVVAPFLNALQKHSLWRTASAPSVRQEPVDQSAGTEQ